MLANSVLLKTEEKQTELYWEDCLKAEVQQITPLEIKKECRDTKPLKTHITAKYRSTVSVHSPHQLQRHLQQHQACRASTLTLAPSKRSISKRQYNQPSFDVVDGNSTSVFRTQCGTKHIGRQTQWQTPTCTFGRRTN